MAFAGVYGWVISWKVPNESHHHQLYILEFAQGMKVWPSCIFAYIVENVSIHSHLSR